MLQTCTTCIKQDVSWKTVMPKQSRTDSSCLLPVFKNCIKTIKYSTFVKIILSEETSFLDIICGRVYEERKTSALWYVQAWQKEGSNLEKSSEYCMPLSLYTANEGPVRIHYKCLVPIHVFPEMKLLKLLFPKQNYNVLSPSSYTLIYLWEIYIFPGSVCLYPAAGKYVDRSLGIYKSLTQTHECGNWDWGRAQFPGKRENI